MNFKRVRKGYDPVQVEAFIQARENQNNAIIENQQKIIDAQADEIRQLRQGIETATVGGAMLADESRRAALNKKCEIFSQTVDLFERLIKSKLPEDRAEKLETMAQEISAMRQAVAPGCNAAAADTSREAVEEAAPEETEGKHLLEFEEIMKGDFTLENMLEDLKEL